MITSLPFSAPIGFNGEDALYLQDIQDDPSLLSQISNKSFIDAPLARSLIQRYPSSIALLPEQFSLSSVYAELAIETDPMAIQSVPIKLLSDDLRDVAYELICQRYPAFGLGELPQEVLVSRRALLEHGFSAFQKLNAEQKKHVFDGFTEAFLIELVERDGMMIYCIPDVRVTKQMLLLVSKKMDIDLDRFDPELISTDVAILNFKDGPQRLDTVPTSVSADLKFAIEMHLRHGIDNVHVESHFSSIEVYDNPNFWVELALASANQSDWQKVLSRLRDQVLCEQSIDCFCRRRKVNPQCFVYMVSALQVQPDIILPLLECETHINKYLELLL